MDNLRILELFSGIGGMHFAFKDTGLTGEIVAAIEINPIANEVYKENFPTTIIYNKNIQKLTSKQINDLNVNTILMSPPCQPFTRVGNQMDNLDSRTDALLHLCSLINGLSNIEMILMENVKGFEKSETRNLFVTSLKNSGYFIQEFIVSPSQIGIPNTRYRYFCLARKSKSFRQEIDDEMKIICDFRFLTTSTDHEIDRYQIQQIIEQNLDEHEYLLSNKILDKYIGVLDITCKDSTNSNCFTKAYTHYAEGTGSVFCQNLTIKELNETLDELQFCTDHDKEVTLKKSLRLRYFTPLEISRLMSFPDHFHFPVSITTRQKYKLLGNSINVKVVSNLLKYLCKKYFYRLGFIY